MSSTKSAADLYESAVMDHLNTLGPVKASRPTNDTRYSDVFVENDKGSTWLEVKMDTRSQLGCNRVKYVDRQWQPSKPGPLQNFCVDRLNRSEQAAEFLHQLGAFCGMDDFDLLTSTKFTERMAPLERVRKFLSQRENKYICYEDNVDLAAVVRDHYLYGKAEPAHYMAAGDEFYRLSDENPLGVPDDVPLLTGYGPFVISISVRTRKYEIFPRCKLPSYPSSPYSVKPGSSKPNPFTM